MPRVWPLHQAGSSPRVIVKHIWTISVSESMYVCAFVCVGACACVNPHTRLTALTITPLAYTHKHTHNFRDENVLARGWWILSESKQRVGRSSDWHHLLCDFYTLSCVLGNITTSWKTCLFTFSVHAPNLIVPNSVTVFFFHNPYSHLTI